MHPLQLLVAGLAWHADVHARACGMPWQAAGRPEHTHSVHPQATHDGRTTCAYRIAQEGLPLLLPHLTRQRISISAAEALRLVIEMSVPLPPELRIATTKVFPGGCVHF